MARRRDISKKDLLDAAERLLQTVGYNGFSFRDLAAEMGISSASMHHHFPTKAQMGCAVVERYRERLNQRMAEIEAETEDWQRREDQTKDWFGQIPDTEARICLLGMLGAEFLTLPVLLQAAVRDLFANAHGWLTKLITQAQRLSQRPKEPPAERQAAQMLAGIQGALVMLRTAAPHPERSGVDWM